MRAVTFLIALPLCAVGDFLLSSSASAQVRYYQRGRFAPNSYQRYSVPRPQRYQPQYQPQSRPQYAPQVPQGSAGYQPLVKPGEETGSGSANKANESGRRGTRTPTYIKEERKPRSRWPRIAGDFEPQKAILISVCELLPGHEDVFLEIINACQGHITVGVLVDDQKQLIEATRVLMKQDREYDHVKFYHLDLDTIWLRDFGPRIGELKNGAVAFDFLYEGTRPLDERMPKEWSRMTSDRYHAVPWTMQGGNLLFNGQGLALTTNRIFEDNYVRFTNLLPGTDPEVERREMVINEFKKNCNLDEIVVLEPLRNEATRHVDMFAAFVAADHIVVASLDRRRDPSNAAVLDRNVRTLESVMVNGKPLRVTRIPTPVREGKYWTTFTNVIFANDLVILPSLNDNSRDAVDAAAAIYRSVLPDHKIAVVNTSSMKKLEGSVHCMSINVPAFAKMPPRYLSLKKAIAYVKKKDAKKSTSGSIDPS